MILGSLIREIMLKTLNEWRDYLSHNRADVYSEKLEKILLFHATFSNLFDESLQQKVHSLYDQCLNKLWQNQERKLLIYDYAPIIILEKIFTDFARDEDEWFHKVISWLSSRQATTRLYSARWLLFYLGKKVDFKNEVLGVSLRDLFVRHAYTNIESHHYDNGYLYALLHFLNLPRSEKHDIYADLREYAQKHEGPLADIQMLEKLGADAPDIPNPFYGYLMACQQTILTEILNQEFHPQKSGTPIQLNLFDQPAKPHFHYYFEDARLRYYLTEL